MLPREIEINIEKQHIVPILRKLFKHSNWRKIPKFLSTANTGPNQPDIDSLLKEQTSNA